MRLGITGKTAIVFAASKGLGKASALALAMEGANVVIAARNKAVLEDAAKEIRDKSGSKVLAVPGDVSKLEDIERLVKATVAEFGGVDILVNNNGGPPPGKFESFSDQDWQEALDQVLMSAVRATRLVLPHMKKAGSGRIINMLSLSAKQPSPNLLLSTSFRVAVMGMAKTLSNDLAPHNIAVNNICTGHFLTDRLKELYKIDEKIAEGQTEEEAWESALQSIPMHRLGKPEEFGALVAFLASEPAAYITGTSIDIDGGLNRSLL